MLDLELPAARTALLSIDFQRDIAMPGGAMAPSDAAALQRFATAMDRAALALATARGNELLVVHVRVAFRPGHPGANRHTRIFRHMATHEALVDGTDGADFVAELAPTDGEVVVTKRGISAFEGTELDTLLRLRGIDTVLVMGLVTHFAVEGTVRSAADRGYRAVTLADCSASGSDARHQSSLQILQYLGPVIEVADLASSIVESG